MRIHINDDQLCHFSNKIIYQPPPELKTGVCRNGCSYYSFNFEGLDLYCMLFIRSKTNKVNGKKRIAKAIKDNKNSTNGVLLLSDCIDECIDLTDTVNLNTLDEYFSNCTDDILVDENEDTRHYILVNYKEKTLLVNESSHLEKMCVIQTFIKTYVKPTEGVEVFISFNFYKFVNIIGYVSEYYKRDVKSLNIYKLYKHFVDKLYTFKLKTEGVKQFNIGPYIINHVTTQINAKCSFCSMQLQIEIPDEIEQDNILSDDGIIFNMINTKKNNNIVNLIINTKCNMRLVSFFENSLLINDICSSMIKYIHIFNLFDYADDTDL